MVGCATTKQAVGDTSETSLDWAGIYLGDLTTEKGDYVDIQISLKEDGTFKAIFSPVDGSTKNTYVNGRFEWNQAGRVIKLDQVLPHFSINYLLVGENKLFFLKENQLDKNQSLTGLPQLSQTQTDSDLTEKYWKLVSINDRQVTRDDFSSKEPHMIFKTEFNRVNGNDGCNGFGGMFVLSEGNKIAFSKMISTMMACPDSFVFNEFMKIVNKDDLTYKVVDEKLTITSKSDVLKFEVVYL